jgi:hypothetical protein
VGIGTRRSGLEFYGTWAQVKERRTKGLGTKKTLVCCYFPFPRCETKGQFSETSFFFSAHLCSDSFYAFRRTLDPSLLSSDVAKKSECSHLRPPTLCISLKLLECRFRNPAWAGSGHRGAAFNSHRGAKVRCGSAVRCVTRRQGSIMGFGFDFSDKVQYRMNAMALGVFTVSHARGMFLRPGQAVGVEKCIA